MKKPWLLLIGFLLLWGPPLAQAKDYCEDFKASNVYQEAYCSLRREGNKEAEAQVMKTVAQQLGYEEDLITLILDQGQDLECGDIQDYMKKNQLNFSQLPQDLRKACPPLEGKPEDREAFSRLLTRSQTAYFRERNFFLTQKRLEKTFTASERYWDGQLEASTSFDLMVDLNLLDTLLFGSQAQWVNDVFTFSKGLDPEEEAPDLSPEDPVPEDLPDSEEQKALPEQGMELNPNHTQTFIHPDCFTQVQNVSTLCGNGEIDLLLGEACDDGNKVEGDGCNNSCQFTAGSLECKDPQALTLQPFSQLPLGQGGKPLCPLHLAQKLQFDSDPQQNSEEEGGEVKAQEAINVPPFIGGVLSPLPALELPACLSGQSLVKVTVGGGGKGKEVSKCIPTEFCGDFNTIREQLFGPHWNTGPQAEIAAAIEAASCVNFTTHNRPLTPYAPNEGCIDCHFRAMAEALDEALQSNVTPLVNTTSAFGLSNRWGPNFSLDLDISVKKVAPRLTPPKLGQKSHKETQEEAKTNKPTEAAVNAADQAVKAGQGSLQPETPASQALAAQVQDDETRRQAIQEGLGEYLALSNSLSDQALNDQLLPQIASLTGSFASIQDSLFFMVKRAEELSKKKVCPL